MDRAAVLLWHCHCNPNNHFRVFIFLFISWYKWVNFLVILKWKSLGTNLSHPQVAIVGTAVFFCTFPVGFFIRLGSYRYISYIYHIYLLIYLLLVSPLCPLWLCVCRCLPAGQAKKRHRREPHPARWETGKGVAYAERRTRQKPFTPDAGVG